MTNTNSDKLLNNVLNCNSFLSNFFIISFTSISLFFFSKLALNNKYTITANSKITVKNKIVWLLIILPLFTIRAIQFYPNLSSIIDIYTNIQIKNTIIRKLW